MNGHHHWTRIVLLTLAAITVSASVARAQPTPAERAEPQRFPPPGWPMPVQDNKPHGFVVGEVLDISPRGDESDISWDMNGWYGGDFNRFWLKSEGEHSVTQADRNLDVQVLYGRFVKKFYDLQFGGGVQTATFQGRNVTRGQAVFGVEAFVPFKSDLETLLFVSQDGDVSGRVTFIRDFFATQRLLLQSRIETNVAAQSVEEFAVGSGLNNLELGLRLRYEIRREFAPYIGVSLDHRFFETADFIRAEGKDASQVRLVFGVRAWR